MTSFRPLICLAVTAALGVVARPAHAINATICVDYAVDYADAGTVDDDWFTDNSDVDAAGVRIQVVRNADNVVVFDDYAADAGISIGCVTATALDPVSHRIRVLTEASVNGDTLKVWNNDTSNQLYARVIPSWYPPYGGSTTFITTPLTDWWRIMAASTWALERSNGGITGSTLVFYNQGCNPGGGSCLKPSNGRVYICPSTECSNNSHNKYLVTHEMGHLMFFLANNREFVQAGTTYVGAICNNGGAGSEHRINSEEYAGAAASEGLAHFWGAYAFNDETEFDCGFDWYGNSVDWDYDNDYEEDHISCEGAPDPVGAPSVDGNDYHGDVCGGASDKGVEYDWLRFAWDLVTDEGIPVEDILTIWDTANPDTWNTDGTGVAEAMSAAAATVGWGSEYDTWSSFNGTDR